MSETNTAESFADLEILEFGGKEYGIAVILPDGSFDVIRPITASWNARHTAASLYRRASQESLSTILSTVSLNPSLHDFEAYCRKEKTTDRKHVDENIDHTGGYTGLIQLADKLYEDGMKVTDDGGDEAKKAAAELMKKYDLFRDETEVITSHLYDRYQRDSYTRID